MTRRTDPQRLSKGRSIFSRHALRIVNLDFEGTGYASFRIDSDVAGHIYETEIRNFLTLQVSTGCSCPDDSAGLCKHRVAAILCILDRMPETGPVSHYSMDNTVVDLPNLVVPPSR